MQVLSIAGTVGKDAELRKTHSGDSVLGFSLAVDNGKGKDGNKLDATWYDCSIWGKRADALSSMITKGTKLALHGRPTCRAHNEKAYIGISVDGLTFQGGGQERRHSDPAMQDPRSGGGGMDDDIPFN